MKLQSSTASAISYSLPAVFIVGLVALFSPSAGRTIQTSSQPNEDCVSVGNRICKLTVEITTRKDRGAGTDNAVYFDIGPMSWRLNTARNDFESGGTDEFDISPPADLKLTTDDILWLRLHKKGLFGITGTRDGFDGAWHPEQVVLIVNGVPWPAANIDEPLNSRCWFWRKPVTMNPPNPYSNAANFARTLRLQPNQELRTVDKLSGFLTIGVKKLGISGWLNLPERMECLNGRPLRQQLNKPWSVCATGRVNASAKSTDGLGTIDLKVGKIEFCGEDGNCYDQAILKDLDAENRPRYLRAEYKYRGRTMPKKDEEVRLCGNLRWDTDKEGWWEIHPRNCQDVTFLSPKPQKCIRPK
jgi:PLAT/LH2 domain